jgi:hypothetical protein
MTSINNGWRVFLVGKKPRNTRLQVIIEYLQFFFIFKNYNI